MKIRRPATRKPAITLVELMVSLVIVGILMIGVFLPVLVSSQEMSRRALALTTSVKWLAEY